MEHFVIHIDHSFLLSKLAFVETGRILCRNTVCPRSSDPFYTITYYIKWVTTSWTYRTYAIMHSNGPIMNSVPLFDPMEAYSLSLEDSAEGPMDLSRVLAPPPANAQLLSPTHTGNPDVVDIGAFQACYTKFDVSGCPATLGFLISLSSFVQNLRFSLRHSAFQKK